jgi:saxitoxin biosynthesis operon SxtJ-like protein
MLKTLWRKWLAVAHAIGRVNSRIVMTLVYFVAMAPFALAVRWFADPLRVRAQAAWRPLELPTPPPSALDLVQRQF